MTKNHDDDDCETHRSGRDADDNVTLLSGDKAAGARARRAVAHYHNGAADKIAAAMDEYDGTYPDFRVYTRRELEEHIAPYMMWLLDRWVDLDGVANDWLANGRNWLLPDGDHGVHVFLSSRSMAEIDEHDIEIVADIDSSPDSK